MYIRAFPRLISIGKHISSHMCYTKRKCFKVQQRPRLMCMMGPEKTVLTENCAIFCENTYNKIALNRKSKITLSQKLC